VYFQKQRLISAKEKSKSKQQKTKEKYVHNIQGLSSSEKYLFRAWPFTG
jgi:hypothetical protein